MNRPATAPGVPTVRQAGEVRSTRVESLRALAALGVLVGHAWGWSHRYGPATYDGFVARALLGGGFGVFLFFALSGYLLFLPFARAAWGGGQPVSLRRYFVNRALRVLPLYYLVVAVLLVVQGGESRRVWWRFALLLQGFWPDSVIAVVPPAWSLVVEVQYYLLLPLLALAVGFAAGGSLRRAAIALGLLGAAALAVRLVTVTGVQPSAVWRYSLPANAVFFFPGLLLALLRVQWDAAPPDWSRRSAAAEPAAWLAAGSALVLAVFWRYSWDALLLPACFLVLGACVLPLRSTRGLGWLEARPLALVGVASYSLYLWHEPIVHRLSGVTALSSFGPLLAVSLAVCLGVAAGSYAVVEARFLRLRR